MNHNVAQYVKWNVYHSLWCSCTHTISHAIHLILHFRKYLNNISSAHTQLHGGRRSPAVACWASDHWVASVTNLGWFGQFHTKSSVWLHGQLLLLKSLVRSLPATLYTFYTILNMLSEWFKPTRSGSMVLSGHGKWLCSYIPRQLGSRTLVAGLWSGRVRGRTRS